MRRFFCIGILLSSVAPARADETATAPAPAARSAAPAEPLESMAPFVPATARSLPPFDQKRARRLYDDNCRVCHGTKGRGDGLIARGLEPRPRDFTRGVYKFRSTPTGQIPTHEDLFDTLGRGLPGTSMTSWSGLSEDDRWQLVQFVERFSKRFEDEPPDRVLPATAAPPRTAERITRGRAAWIKAQCARCHGDDGRGFGPAARTQKDDLGRPIYPFNLTRGDNYRVGPGVEDVFRTLFTGLDGTSMPSYEGAITEEEGWDLSHYVRSLAANGRVR